MSSDATNTTTCWTMIRGAAAGDAKQRQAFARQYAGPIEAYLRARWRTAPMQQDVDDAVQEVFVESFRDGGMLERASQTKAGEGGFRGYLYGLARNIALRFEQKRGRRREGQPPEGLITHGLVEDEATLSAVFDRAWAANVMRDAAQRHADWAATAGDDALRRLDLLRARFGEGAPIREIATRWNTPAEDVHRQYARARQEFRAALREAVAFHLPGSPERVDEECARLLASLE